jgi:lipoprotein-anchoring transpeptidase ErfK/SrfK
MKILLLNQQMIPVNNETLSTLQVLQQAQLALKKGNKREARRLAELAISLEPTREEPWLLLAALGSPRASIAYLGQALELNPNSKRARKGMHWAVRRLREDSPSRVHRRNIISLPITPDALTQQRPAVLPWVIIFSIIALGFLVWFGTPTLSFALGTRNVIQLAQVDIEKSTYTPTPTSTYTPTPTFTPTPTPTNTPSPTPTFTPTNTPTPEPTKPPLSVGNSTNTILLPPGIEKGEKWIDIDLTHQRVYAYKGKNLIFSFITSTGTWQHPTVTGQYRIYVKYRYAHMSGPGYYLPNVPYVMYFYKGYGIHGTYWHNNFGTPMSHGCVNLRTDDAGSVYNWASIGTLVNIHY